MALQWIHLLNNTFHDTTPFFVSISFVLLIIFIFLNSRQLKDFFKKIPREIWIFLFIIFALGLIVRLFLLPHYHFMTDDWYYMQAGKDMLLTGSQFSYSRSIGWPFILAVSFGIFGISHWVALYASSILGALTIFNVFFLTFLISKNKNLSLISAGLFSLLPSHLQWSGNAETDVPSIFFITLSLFFCFLYYRKKENSLLWLSLISLAFAVQFRPENYILPVLFLLGFFIFKIDFFKKINFKFILPWTLLIVLSFPNLIQVLDFQLPVNWIESDTKGAQTGDNWSLSNLINTSKDYGIHFFEIGRAHV